MLPLSIYLSSACVEKAEVPLPPIKPGVTQSRYPEWKFYTAGPRPGDAASHPVHGAAAMGASVLRQQS